MKQVYQFTILLKRLTLLVATVFIFLLAWDIYSQLIPNVWYRKHLALSLVGLWLLTAYIVLPYVHRLLARIYVPVNFIGRTRTRDGLLGDPVNLSINGSKRALIDAMAAAGWQRADPLNIITGVKIVFASVFRRSYANAPVSALFLFGRKQDLIFQQEVGNNPRKRHHVRFWQVPHGWYLPGGYKVDWIGAATYDDAVGISLFTGQITHRISANVDKERDFLIQSLHTANMLRSSTYVQHFFDSYQSRNGFGHHYITDGSIVIADLLVESPARTRMLRRHANLDTIQEEIRNLATAQGIPLKPIEKQAMIAHLQQLVTELETSDRSDHIASQAVDIVIQSLQLVSVLGKHASEIYHTRMDHHWHALPLAKPNKEKVE